ncbi:MAG: phytanoyl-CoA dioxygenase family protein, partial [Myxococcota bacterium]
LRDRCRRALQRVAALGDDALAAYDRDELGGDALVLCHRGELLAWLGRFEDAEAELRAALAVDRRTRWATIGLSAIALHKNGPGRALELLEEGIKAMDGTVGASVHVHRGEALRRLAEDAAENGLDGTSRRELLAGSKEALLVAAQLHPSRVSTFLNLYLVAEASDDATLQRTCARRLFALAAPLLASADASLRARGADASMGALARESLRISGANRSSTCATFRTGTRLRALVSSPADPRALQLAALRRLRRSLALEAREAPKAYVGAPPVEGSFEADGFVVLRGAFDASVAAHWRRDALERIRAFPDRDVKGFSGADEALWSFQGTTSAHARIVLQPSWRVPWERFSPRLDAALDAMLGDLRAPETLSNYLILNVNERAGEPVPTRAADTTGWHLDEPGSVMNLAQLRNGLVLVLLFSDCPPGHGGTLLLPGSQRAVVQRLEQPGAEDAILSNTWRDIVKDAGPTLEVTGKAGDAFICSALLLHTSSPNGSGKVRFMANPMVHLRRPPEPGGSTPFERALDAWRSA